MLWTFTGRRGYKTAAVRREGSIMRTSLTAALLLSVVAFLQPVNLSAQTLVIQGGTLIDGTGRAPLENSVIVIEGNRFSAIGKSGEVQIPPGSQIVDVSGKTVMPGFI